MIALRFLPDRTDTWVLAVLVALLLWPATGRTDPSPLIGHLLDGWPAPDSLAEREGEPVTLASANPFVLADVGHPRRAPPFQGAATLYLPDHASADRPVPGVVLLHGAGGVSFAREHTYAMQFAEMGAAALVVDAFLPRRHLGAGFTERLIQVTETMILADAYAALHYFDQRPEVDSRRVALMGFSYGGMATLFAAHSQVADAFAPRGPRFAAHVSIYPPCIARFRDTRATGAPILLLYGTGDEIVRPDRCAEILDDLSAGGARSVEVVAYDGAYHLWDGAVFGPRRTSRNLAACRFDVRSDGTVRDGRTWLQMVGPASRQAILAMCVDGDGYYIGRDDGVRDAANRRIGAFLAEAFSP